MSHVRDGELHAYLDGALDRLGSEVADQVRGHLATCEDCQSRVDQERDLREEASALLDVASPREIVAPPFEELLRRAAVGGSATPSGGSSPGKSTFPAYKWAWAASLVLALGTGWAIGGGSLNFRDFPSAPLQEAAAANDRAELESIPLDEGFAEAPAELDAVGTEAGARSAGALRQQDRSADADASQARARAPQSPPPPAVARDLAATREARENAEESDEERTNEGANQSGVGSSLADAAAPKREDAPQPVLAQVQADAEPILEEAADSFEDARRTKASDGQPLLFEDRPILAVVEDPSGGPSGVLQQLANGDSVMFVWSGDVLAENEVGRLEASLDSLSPAASGQDERLLARRIRPTEAQGASARSRALGPADTWSTVVRLSRGAALLTVYGSGDEAELRAALAAAGLIPPDG